VAKVLEDHYFTMQLLPVLDLIKMFAKVVFDDERLVEVMTLKKARILLNLGLKEEGEQMKLLWDQNPNRYILTDEEKKQNLEKIKALQDENDNLIDKFVPFTIESEAEPLVLESLSVHEVWLNYAEELLKWGEFIEAKPLIVEVNLHARILKDQDNYSRSLMLLSTIAYLEGESASALRCDMLCHQYAKGVELVEQAIEHTFDLLLLFNKLEDAATLINNSIDMALSLREKHSNQQALNNTSNQNARSVTINNLPLEYLL